METRIKDYELFVKKKLGDKLSVEEAEKLQKNHVFMVQNFQHERLIHLIVTLFFVLITIIFLMTAAVMTYIFGVVLAMTPLYVLVAILVILSACYVKHYYFLENHVQKLYDMKFVAEEKK